MKRIITAIALLAATSVAEAQVKIRCFSEQGAANYAKVGKMIKDKGEGNMTSDKPEIINNQQ